MTKGNIPVGAEGGATGDGASDAGAPRDIALLRADNALCLPQPLPTDGAGASTCVLLLMLAEEGDDTACALRPGLRAAPASLAGPFRKLEGARAAAHPVCELAQIPRSAFVDGSCVTSQDAGWCYVVGAAAGGACAQALRFSTNGTPPAGAAAALACF